MNPAPSRLNASINITPLVDVMLVLLIIFIVVTPLVGKGVDVELPRTSAPPELGATAERNAILSLHYAGDPDRAEIFLDETPIAGLPALARELAAMRAQGRVPAFTVRADARLRFAAVRPVMKALQDAGYPAAALAAAPATEAGS